MWFKSKLQHPDPEVRRSHVEQLAVDDEILVSVLREDSHPDVRATALGRVEGLQVLAEASAGDTDERIRNLATARLQKLVAGIEAAHEVTERIAFLEQSVDDRLVRYIARSGVEPELRRQAVQMLLSRADEPAVLDLLGEIAAEDAVQEIRALAADSIRDAERLEKLLELSRGRDKSIHRMARERLDAIQARQTASEELVRCCADIEQLQASEFSTDGKAEQLRLERLAESWQMNAAVIKNVDQALTERFAAAKQNIETRLGLLRETAGRRKDIMQELAAHLDGDDSVAVATLTRRWHELGDATPAEDREFDQLVRKVAEHDNRIDRDRTRELACRELLKEMQQCTDAETFLQADLARLEKRWKNNKMPESELLAEELGNQYASLHESLRNRLAKQAAALENDIETVTTLLQEYETALESGRLSDAVSVHDKAVSQMARIDMPDSRRRKLQQRLKAGEPRLAELKRWRHWGTDRKREELCEKAEALIDSDMKLPSVARAVRDYRDQWKALDKSDGPAGKKLWTRFDNACEKAYEPCQALFDQQKTQRAQNMERRVAICEELEKLATDTDWEAPPWRELADSVRELERNWHRAGSVDRRQKNKIQKRYDTAQAALDEHLDGMRKREVDRREKLIVQIEALAGEEDTRAHVNAVRQAQKNWKPLVQAGRRAEQKLWKRFRAACDAVFERRKEHFAAADQERAQNLGEKLAVQGQVGEMITQAKEQLSAGTGDANTVAELRKKVRQLGNGWRRIGPVPRDKQSIDKEFKKNCADLNKLCDRLENQLARKTLEDLRHAADQCEALELQVAAGAGIDNEVAASLTATVNDADERLLQRCRLIEAAAGGDTDAATAISAALPQNLATKQQLCLQMEIAANIESPPECQEERMQYRVAQLSESMSGNRQVLEPLELERAWYCTGAVPQGDQEQLEKRFRRALQALSGS